MDLLAFEYTGEITLRCAGGGVKGMYVSGGKEIVEKLKEARMVQRELTQKGKKR